MTNEELKKEQVAPEKTVVAPADGQPPDETPETTPEETPEETPATQFRNRIQKQYPDVNPEDENAFYGKANEHVAGLEDYKSKNEAVTKDLLDAFNSHPELASFMKDIVKGAPVTVALARNFDLNAIKPQEGDPNYEDWNKAIGERKTKLADREKYLKEIEDNVQLSAKEVDKFQKKSGLDDEGVSNFLKGVDEIISDAVRGKVTEATLSKFYKEQNADTEKEKAVKAAVIEAKNKAIEPVKEKIKAEKGDGIPDIKSTGKEKPIQKQVANPWVDAIDRQIARRNR